MSVPDGTIYPLHCCAACAAECEVVELPFAPLRCVACEQAIGIRDSLTGSGEDTWHTRCWNAAEERRRSRLKNTTMRRNCPREERWAGRCECYRKFQLTLKLHNPKTKGHPTWQPHPTERQREVIDFAPNVPVPWPLKYNQGKHVVGQYGDRDDVQRRLRTKFSSSTPPSPRRSKQPESTYARTFTITQKWDGVKGSP